MSDEKILLTPSKIAERLGASPAKVKHAIKSLGIEPAEKKGSCSLYDNDAVQKIAYNLK